MGTVSANVSSVVRTRRCDATALRVATPLTAFVCVQCATVLTWAIYPVHAAREFIAVWRGCR
jgi:hypothetical protein